MNKLKKEISTTGIPFHFIDLFAGIGGIRQGMEYIGGQCVFSSEWDKYACITYKENYNETPYGDITKIHEKTIPPFDMLCAGFPCQPFSIAGHQKGFSDKRGNLFFEILRIVKYHKPPILFLENVKNFKSHNKGQTFLVIKNELEKLGYHVFSEVLNAKHFGLPQNRERIYIICFLDNVEFKFPKKTMLNTRVKDILEIDVPKKYTISNKLWEGHQQRKIKNKEKGNGFGYSLFTPESEYTSTITARYYKDGAEILIKQNNNNPRKLTPREAARLQGFSDNFKIPVSDAQAYKQFGNSVPINVIKSIASEISNVLPFIKLKTHYNTSRSKINTKEKV